jgi:hypothetical protein
LNPMWKKNIVYIITAYKPSLRSLQYFTWSRDQFLKGARLRLRARPLLGAIWARRQC